MSPPDVAEPIIGFRAWRLSTSGVLSAWAFADHIWSPGINRAKCAHANHRAPVHSCRCGLYALTNLHDPRLNQPPQAVGSIAAWGAIELHRTGFRAQYAMITALCCFEDTDRFELKFLCKAARRYGVPLFAAAELPAYAGEFARPISLDRFLRREADRSPMPEDGTRGIWIEEHLWSAVVGGNGWRVGVTRQLADCIEIGSSLRLPECGDRIACGGTIAAIGAGATELRLRSPCDLTVCAVNPAAVADPDLARVDPEGQGWLLEATPSKAAEQGNILWGKRAETLYRASLCHAGERGDPFCWQRPSWTESQPVVRNAADALRIFEAELSRPRFRDSHEAVHHIQGRLDGLLRDAALHERLCRSKTRLVVRMHLPEGDVAIDLRGRPSVQSEAPDEIVLYTDAETADDFFAGRVDIAAALRSRRIQTSAPHRRVLAVASVIKAMHRPYAALASSDPYGAQRRS